jgi:nitronate monooxygenase
VRGILETLRIPVVQAPLAGGASTPALAAAVMRAGGLGFVAAGYRTPEAVRADIGATRELGARAFGVNVFVPGPGPADPAGYAAYARAVAEEAARRGVAAGEPRWDDDGWDPKLALLLEEPVPVVSFTFGCPPADTVAALHAAGTEVWVTVTEPGEAREAVGAGADALVVQGVEAGGHRGTFSDEDGAGLVGLLALLQLVRAAVGVPLVASGGIATGRGLAGALAAGAAAGQIGTALMRCPEAGTAAVHRERLAAPGATALTRAFSGRTARGIVNAFGREHTASAPRAYPEVHHLTAPLRARARETGDGELLHLWAGQARELATEAPAEEVVAAMAAEARAALEAAAARLRPGR